MPRILAIDYGQKRTGIAVTDEMQIIASGLTTVASETTIDFLKDYFAREKVERVLVGEPKQIALSVDSLFKAHRLMHIPESFGCTLCTLVGVHSSSLNQVPGERL